MATTLLGVLLAFAIAGATAHANGAEKIQGKLQRLERSAKIAGAMKTLSAGRALKVQSLEDGALLLTAKGFRFGRHAGTEQGQESARYAGVMQATGYHDVYKMSLFQRIDRRGIDPHQIEGAVDDMMKDGSAGRLQEWNPVTGGNGGKVVLVAPSLFH